MIQAGKQPHDLGRRGPRREMRDLGVGLVGWGMVGDWRALNGPEKRRRGDRGSEEKRKFVTKRKWRVIGEN